VLIRDGARRVILSWGSHTGNVLGTIRGHALSVMTFEAHGDETVPHLTAYVLIENPIAAGLARMLAPLFGGFIDRNLAEGFRATAQAAEWVLANQPRFCAWLASSPLSAERRAALPLGIPQCAAEASVSPAGARRDTAVPAR
jgi:hypothetical protein